MANVTVSVPTSNITVDTTNSIVTVASTTSNVVVGETVLVSNAAVRSAISVSNESGFGNLAYDSTSTSNGIIQYTGVSTSDIRSQLSATAPITYDSGTGVIDIDSNAIFTGKTTDDLAEGTTNIYFSTSGATVNTDALPEGSTNLYYTTDKANAAILDYEGALPGITTLDASGNINLGGNINITRSGAEDVFVNGNDNDFFKLTGFKEVSLQAVHGTNVIGDFEILGREINLRADASISGVSTVVLGDPNFLNPSSVNIDHNIRSGGPLVLQGGYSKSMNEETKFLQIETVASEGAGEVVRTYADFNQRGNATIYLDPNGRADSTGGFRLMNNANTSVFSVNHLGTTSISGNLTVNSDSIINGNLQVQGNIDYVNVEDLLVNDQSITLNYGNVAQDAQIIIDRTGAGGNNVDIKWNETTDKWTFSNDGTTYFSLPTSTTDLAEGTNLYFTTDRANAAIGAYEGDLIGDLDGAVVTDVYNDTGSTLNKGDAVYLTGGNNGDNPHVALADADDATKMPALGIVRENITNNTVGQVVTSGVMNDSSHGYTLGADLFISTTAGALAETAPTSESGLIQKIGKVVSANHIIVQGAFRTNATPNLNEGNIFLGSTSNTTITVTPDSNFETTGNAFSLSNALSDVNTITSESASGLTFNSSDGTIVTSKFGVNSTVTETANIAGKGFGVFNFNDGTNTSISYSGTDVFEWYEIDGSVVSGSTTMTITSVVRGIDSTTAAVSDIIVGQVIANGTSASTPGSTDMIIFPDDAYVVSVNSGASTVEMSKPAVQTTSFTHTTDGIILDAGLVDTTTGLVIKLLSDLRSYGAGSDSSLFFRSFRNFPFGYPASGPVPTDFDIITAGTASDYSMSLSAFMLGQTPITNDTTVLNAPLGITIGENAQLTNRAENDGFSSFGMNMMWDGLTSYSRNIQPQMLFKSYTDNAEQESAVFTAGAGPRLFFSSADGNSSDNAFDTYPKANQELGRLAFWGTTGEQLTPSSYNVPGFISVAAADDWDTWGGGVAGNTNVYMGSTSDGLNPDTFLSYKEGELLLGSNSSKPITFAPAYNGSARDPDDAYTGNYTTWANVNYSNTGAAKGAKLSVTNGGSDGVGVVGDLEIGVFRNDITDGGSNVTVANNYYSTSSNYYSSISVNAGPTLIFGALFGTQVDLTGLNDGDQATFDNYTGTLGGEINGNTYYVKVLTGPPISNPLYANYGIGLYDDAALTTPTTLTSSTGIYGSSGTIEYTGLPSVTDREYKFKLEEQSEKLQFVTVDATPTSTTLIEYSEAITDFKNRVKLKSHTSAEILALTGMTAGEMVYNSTDNLVAYYDGTDWRNIAQGAIIT